MTGCAIWPERVGLWGRRAKFKFGRCMGFDRGRKGDRGGRGRDKSDGFGGDEPAFGGDFGGGFQERGGYGGGGGGRGGYGGGGGGGFGDRGGFGGGGGG